MHVEDGQDPPSINIDGTEVEFTTSYTYMESTVTIMGGLQEEINRRRGLTVAALNFLWIPLSNSQATKMWVYNTSVTPVLLHGSETWPLTQDACEATLYHQCALPEDEQAHQMVGSHLK